MKEMTGWEAQDHQKFLIPLGTWKPNSKANSPRQILPIDHTPRLVNGRDRYASELTRQNFFKLVTSWRPAFLTHGFDEADVDNWIAKAREEIVNMKPHVYVRVSALYSNCEKVQLA